MSQRAFKGSVLAGIVILVVVLFATGTLSGLRDQDRVEEFLTDSGPWGPLVYIAAFVVAQPLSLPGAVLIIPATFVWSWWEVALYSLAGGMVASTVGFGLARWIARDWVERRLPARFRTWQQRLVDHELVAIIGLRLLTGYAPAADWLLGVSPVRIRAFLVGTALGLTPTTVAMSIWGDEAVRGISGSPRLGIGIVVVVAIVAAVAVQRRQRRLRGSR